MGDPFLQGGPCWLLLKIAHPLAEKGKKHTPCSHKHLFPKASIPSGLLPGKFAHPQGPARLSSKPQRYKCTTCASLGDSVPLWPLYGLTRCIIPAAHWWGSFPPSQTQTSYSFSGKLENRANFQSSLLHTVILAIQQIWANFFRRTKAAPNLTHYYLKEKKVLFIKARPPSPTILLTYVNLVCC